MLVRLIRPMKREGSFNLRAMLPNGAINTEGSET
jgi:hypothetical protein